MNITNDIGNCQQENSKRKTENRERTIWIGKGGRGELWIWTGSERLQLKVENCNSGRDVKGKEAKHKLEIENRKKGNAA